MDRLAARSSSASGRFSSSSTSARSSSLDSFSPFDSPRREDLSASPAADPALGVSTALAVADAIFAAVLFEELFSSDLLEFCCPDDATMTSTPGVFSVVADELAEETLKGLVSPGPLPGPNATCSSLTATLFDDFPAFRCPAVPSAATHATPGGVPVPRSAVRVVGDADWFDELFLPISRPLPDASCRFSPAVDSFVDAFASEFPQSPVASASTPAGVVDAPADLVDSVLAAGRLTSTGRGALAIDTGAVTLATGVLVDIARPRSSLRNGQKSRGPAAAVPAPRHVPRPPTAAAAAAVLGLPVAASRAAFGPHARKTVSMSISPVVVL